MSKRACFATALLALACGACRQDMQRQPKYTPLEKSLFFADGRAARPIPPGTVSTDATLNDPERTEGRADGKFTDTIPLPVTEALLKRGQERFNIYCSPCHGRRGDGNGTIAARGFKYPANLLTDDVRKAPPGYIYAVIVHGFGAMADYGDMVRSVRDRWAIVAYIRALQLSQHATLADVPPKDRQKLGGRP